MIKIKIFEKGNIIYGIECSGHSGYAESGSDIVCSAVSSIVGSCSLGLVRVLKLPLTQKRDDKNAYFKLMLGENLNSEPAQVLLKTAKLSLQEIEKDYKKYVAIEIIGGSQ